MIDLHTHSTRSDGSDPPERVAELAAAAGCAAFALTDHDRLDGLPAAGARAAQLGVRLVPGCEISCRWTLGSFHLLVYFVEPGEGPFQDELEALQRVRDERNVRMAEVLGLDYGELLAEAGGSGAGRPHAAALLVREGRAASIADAFARFLGQGMLGDVGRRRTEPARAIALARASGGVAVVAHPLSMGLERAALDSAVAELAELGLSGLEAYYGRYDAAQRDVLTALARARGLAVTGGSDHHGSYKPDLSVGIGRGDLEVPDDVLVTLEARRPDA